MSYAAQSTALDSEILSWIDRWKHKNAEIGEGDFDDLALRLFAYQFEYNQPYSRYCRSLGFSPAALPATWHDIPPIPAAAFKEATLATFDPAAAALAFETSGTTSGTGGRHYMEVRALYDEALAAGFARAMLADGLRLRYFNVVPNPAERPQSSLGYMMALVSLRFGDSQTGWYLRGDALLTDAFVADARAAVSEGQPVCIAATAFALVHLLDALESRGVTLTLPSGSRIMETGGFKGRARTVERGDLYARAARVFSIGVETIVAEYGMTELTSQYYDAASSRGTIAGRRKIGPPWLRARIVGPDGKTVPNGVVGSLVHVDLANRSSCVAVATEDLAVAFDDGDGFVLIGREADAALRGCSLDAESLGEWLGVSGPH